MFKFRIPFFPFRRPRKPSDEHFYRKVESSHMLQHLCGFDNELYDAISGLNG